MALDDVLLAILKVVGTVCLIAQAIGLTWWFLFGTVPSPCH
jgi:hypothetical protein